MVGTDACLCMVMGIAFAMVVPDGDTGCCTGLCLVFSTVDHRHHLDGVVRCCPQPQGIGTVIGSVTAHQLSVNARIVCILPAFHVDVIGGGFLIRCPLCIERLVPPCCQGQLYTFVGDSDCLLGRQCHGQHCEEDKGDVSVCFHLMVS